MSTLLQHDTPRATSSAVGFPSSGPFEPVTKTGCQDKEVWSALMTGMLVMYPMLAIMAVVVVSVVFGKGA